MVFKSIKSLILIWVAKSLPLRLLIIYYLLKRKKDANKLFPRKLGYLIDHTCCYLLHPLFIDLYYLANGFFISSLMANGII
jgi:hypothetical protein